MILMMMRGVYDSQRLILYVDASGPQAAAPMSGAGTDDEGMPPAATRYLGEVFLS
jgi:hypothetical protein